jgi:hypothetical protein
LRCCSSCQYDVIAIAERGCSVEAWRATGAAASIGSASSRSQKIHADIEAYNRRSPNEPFPIDDTVSRIISNDPERARTRKRRAPRTRPLTANPGVFTVQDIAERLGATVGAWLGERGFEITASDIRTFRWMVAFFQIRFLADAEPETASMADRIREGDTVVIDTAQRVPRQGDPVAVNIENEGGILGYWRAEAARYYLDKHNVSEFAPVKLPHLSEWRVIGVVTLVQSRVRRQDRPTSRR